MKILVTFLFIIHSLAFPEINNENEVFAYYEQYSFTPLLHVYFDKHFHKSKQFEAFEVVLNELQNDIQDYSQIVFTDCDQNTGNI